MNLSAGIAIAALGMIACSDPTDNASASFQTAVPPVAATREQAPDPAGAAAATKAFQDRMREYVSFHHNVQKTVPALTETADPKKLSERQTALALALIKQRPDAKQGDFFIQQYQPYLRQIVNDDFSKRAPADRKALIVELPKGVKIDVNMEYPTTLPLATFPGKLLRALPELPPELEYRIVGRSLVLRDIEANVIVDLMRDVFPIPV